MCIVINYFLKQAQSFPRYTSHPQVVHFWSWLMSGNGVLVLLKNWIKESTWRKTFGCKIGLDHTREVVGRIVKAEEP